MACTTKVAVVIRKSLKNEKICSVGKMPCIVRRYFFGDIKIEGDGLCFVVHRCPPEWDAYLMPVKGVRTICLDEYWFEHTLSDEQELEAFLKKVRCALRNGRFYVIFEKGKWQTLTLGKNGKNGASNGHKNGSSSVNGHSAPFKKRNNGGKKIF